MTSSIRSIVNGGASIRNLNITMDTYSGMCDQSIIKSFSLSTGGGGGGGGGRLFPIRERGLNYHSQELQLHEAKVCVCEHHVCVFVSIVCVSVMCVCLFT